MTCGLLIKNFSKQKHLTLNQNESHMQIRNLNCFTKLTFYSIDTHFDSSRTDTFKNIVGKGEIACVEQFLFFPQCFLLYQISVSPLVHIFDFISLYAVELEESIGLSG